MLTLTRRGLLVLGGTGAAGVALAGCSEATEPRDEASAEDLIGAEAKAEGNLARAYALAAGAVPSGEEKVTLLRFAAAAKRRAAGFSGGDEDTAPEADGGPDFPEALSACANLANDAIAAHLDAAGLLDEVEGRAPASASLAACAAELAVINGFAGDPEVPSAFVTGGEEDPFESFDGAPTGGSSTTSATSAETTDTTDEP